jgi:hypothetical protein
MPFKISEKPNKTYVDNSCYKNYMKLIAITFKNMSVLEAKKYYKANYKSIGVVIEK